MHHLLCWTDMLVVGCFCETLLSPLLSLSLIISLSLSLPLPSMIWLGLCLWTMIMQYETYMPMALDMDLGFIQDYTGFGDLGLGLGDFLTGLPPGPLPPLPPALAHRWCGHAILSFSPSFSSLSLVQGGEERREEGEGREKREEEGGRRTLCLGRDRDWRIVMDHASRQARHLLRASPTPPPPYLFSIWD